jgi:hypothetical protein
MMVDKAGNQKIQLTSDDVDRLIHGVNYARWDHPAVMKGFNLIRTINKWLSTCYSDECCPHAHMSVAAFGMCILINDIPIWDSENDSEENLTLDYCKAKLKEHALYLQTPFE